MMTLLAAIGAIVILAAGIFMILNDILNIAEALTSEMDVSVMENRRNNEKVQLRNAYAVR